MSVSIVTIFFPFLLNYPKPREGTETMRPRASPRVPHTSLNYPKPREGTETCTSL